jgi:hypothetical protein
LAEQERHPLGVRRFLPVYARADLEAAVQQWAQAEEPQEAQAEERQVQN